MPNWVHNRITFKGSGSDLAKIAEELKEENAQDPISFNKLIPRPADKDDDAYNWNISNWGTKWDACHADSELESFGNKPRLGELFYSFDTAWSTPAPVIDAMIAKFGHVEMFYDYEEEQGWGGSLSAFNGEILQQAQYDVPNSHKELVERTGTCWCQNDESFQPVFDDCFGARASEREDITDEAKETAKSLSPGWHSTFDDLLETAKFL